MKRIFLNRVSIWRWEQYAILFFVIIFLETDFLFAQKPYTPVLGDPITEPWRWKRYHELDGKGINHMLQTKDGYYWFATSKGLYSFNGFKWTNLEIPNQGKSCFVRNLCFSYDSLSFYIATDSGLYQMTNNKVLPIFVNNGNKRIERLFKINKVILLHDSSILASIGINQHNSLLKIKGLHKTIFAGDRTIDNLKNRLKNVTYICVDKRLQSDDRTTIESIFQDHSQNIWLSIVPKTGIKKIVSFRFSQNNFDQIINLKVVEESANLRMGRLNEFAQTKDSKIWIINSDSEIGIYIISGNKWNQVFPENKSELDHLHTSILVSKDGTVWVGGFGLFYTYKNNKWTTYKIPEINVPNSRVSIYEDLNGYLWIYGDKKEIYQIDYSNKTWITYKGLNFQAQSADGKEWYISVDNKVVVNDKGNWYAYTTADGLPDGIVKLIITSKGLPLVAGSNKEIASVAFFNNGKWLKQTFPELSWGIDARTVFEDSKGNVWLGCAVNAREKLGQLSGAIKLENPGSIYQKKTHYYVKHGIKNSNSYGIGETKDGTIWMCGSSLHSFDGNKWDRVTQPFENTQYQEIIANNKGGDLWIGSRYYGILKTSDGKNWQIYNVENGLLSNTIISILPLSVNDIWVATDNDICRYDGKIWTTNIFPEQMTLSRESGELLNGAGKLWINHSPREWKRRVVNDYIVTTETANMYQTMGYKADSFPPDTKIKFYSKEVSYYGNTVISWEGSDLSLNTQNSRIAFSYRINNGEWSPFMEKPLESFTGLASGNYRFEVRARDLDYNIDPTPAIIEFEVLNPVWKQKWFISLIIIFIATIIVYEIREKKRKYNLLKLNTTLLEIKNSLETKQLEIIEQNQILEQQKIHIIEQNNREKEAQQLKLRFFTNVSHEFRTPLTIINGIILKLGETSISKSNPELTENLVTLNRNSNQLLKLINQLMDFRKLETGALQLKVRKGDICWYVKEVCDSFNNLAGLNQIRLEFSSPGKFEVYFDPDFIEKIINNLLSNALKFTPKGGVVKVSIHITDIKNNEFFAITVEDTGIGIPSNEIEKIFEPFYQVNNEKMDQNEGTGIGLSLVNYLVRAHYGQLEVRSIFPVTEKTAGFITCFTLKLPKYSDHYTSNEIIDELETVLDQTSSTVPETQFSINKDNISNYLILIVEDNTDLRNLISSSVKEHFDFCEADNGLTAFDMAVDVIPDLIVSDIMMPKMNGVELCRKLKGDVRTSHIPVILLTARTADEHKLEGYLSGADDYVTKPFNMSLLITRIRNLIEIRSLLRKQFSREFRYQPSEEVINTVDSDFLKKVIEVIENNIANPEFGVDLLSNEVNISTRNLLRKIQSLTDSKPVELIRNVRLKKAEQLLLKNQLSISEIAYDVGFTDPGYFTKCFTSYFGMSPKEYQKRKFVDSSGSNL